MTNEHTGALPPPARNPGPPTAALPTSAAPMWWDGGDRAITAREKALIEEHGPSSFSIPLVRAAATPPAELADTDVLEIVARYVGKTSSAFRYIKEDLTTRYAAALDDALAATGKQQVGDIPEDVVERCRTLPTDKLLNCALEVYARSCRYETKGQHDAAMAYKDEIIRRIDGCAAQVGEVQGDGLLGYVRAAAIKALREDDEVTGVMVHVEELTDSVPVYFDARQPVAQVPVAYRYRDGKHWGYCDRKPVDPDITGEPLYAAPPAQGIDLGELRAIADQWKEVAFPFSYEGQCAQRAVDACRADVLALIDGQRDSAPEVQP